MGLESNLIDTRVLAGVTVPDTPLIREATELARKHSDPYLFNHSMRSWLFAVLTANSTSAEHDPEVLAVATILHDIGLTKAFNGPLRFEVEGANAARSFAKQQGLTDYRAQLIWDGVALNSTPSIGLYKETEVALCTAGIGVDWGGWGIESVAPPVLEQILEAYPRLGMKRNFAQAVCGVVQSRPATTYDNFARDFGERFIPGYEKPSTVDMLLNAPFKE